MKPEHKDIMKARKRNIRLTVAYDGTNYNGFQRQNPPAVAYWTDGMLKLDIPRALSYG